MGRKITREDILRDWPAGEYLYKSPDYLPGTHPAEAGDVTWHTGTQLSKAKAQADVARPVQALRKIAQSD
jgi:hypothetical protein